MLDEARLEQKQYNKNREYDFILRYTSSNTNLNN